MKIKSKVGKLLLAPWNMSEKLFETFTLVTENNRKEVLVLGRVLYSIDVSGKIRTYCGLYEVDPRMVKGRMFVSNHPLFPAYNVWVNSTETVEEYKYRFKTTELRIKQKRLFYRESDPLVKYKRT